MMTGTRLPMPVNRAAGRALWTGPRIGCAADDTVDTLRCSATFS